MKLSDFLHPSGTAQGIYSSGISVDAEGDWYYKGNKIIREDILALFFEHLRFTSEQTFLIEWDGQFCSLEVADTPFVISRVDRRTSETPEGVQREEILLSFKHLPGVDSLDPSTLHVGRDNVLYCRVRGGEFPARFSRPAYYQLAEWIREDRDTGGFSLELNGQAHAIETLDSSD